jgi:S1-C subfamily serine protease
VRIKVGDGGGSGVLMTKKGNTYMVLTNAHVVREEAGIKIQTPDVKIHVARRVKDIQVGNFDLALLEFTSTASYQLAKFDNFDKRYAALNEGREIFGAGFPYDAQEMRFVEGELKSTISIRQKC